MNPTDLKTLLGPVSRSRMESSKPMDQTEFVNILTGKLVRVKEDQERKERLNKALKMGETDSLRGGCMQQQKAFTDAILRKMSPQIEDNDQDILDQHVSRVFSPLVSPGTASPRQAITSRPLPPIPQRSAERPFATDPYQDGSAFAMRHSKSIPEHASRKKQYAGSNYYDSGISVGYSTYKSTKPT